MQGFQFPVLKILAQIEQHRVLYRFLFFEGGRIPGMKVGADFTAILVQDLPQNGDRVLVRGDRIRDQVGRFHPVSVEYALKFR